MANAKGFLDKDGGFGAIYDDIVFLSGARTPFGKFMGSLAYVKPTELAAIASKEALIRSQVKPEQVDQVVFGNVYSSSADSLFFPRHVLLKCGIPFTRPASLVQRICGTGFEVIIQGAEQMALGKANVVMVGGAENMTLVPTASYGGRMGHDLGRTGFVDVLWDALLDTHCGFSMGQTSDNLSKKYGITRQAADEFALLSQKRAADAMKGGRLTPEIVPVVGSREIRVNNKTKQLAEDEYPRPDTTIEKLTSLSPVFNKDGVSTAGNSSGIVDGAAAMVMTTGAVAKANGWKPIGRLVASATGGVEPQIMGIGPVKAVRLLEQHAGAKVGQFDLVEINEAFSAQYLAVEKELGLDRNKTNVNGGAIALGHPLAATGTRLTTSILMELKRRNMRQGLVSACIGGGQGTALMVESI